MSDAAADESTAAVAVLDDMPAPTNRSARYVYGIVPVDSGAAADLGAIGLEGARVHVAAWRRVGALVHDCPTEPYVSSDDAIAATWVLAHHEVLQLAMARWRAVLPVALNTIIEPSPDKTADENLLAWLEAEHDRLREGLDTVQGKAEYGLQISYAPSVVLLNVAEELPEIRRLEEEAKVKPAAVAYLYRAEMERALQRETERRVQQLFTSVFERACACAERVRVEKNKNDGSNLRMVVNLNCLVALERYPELKALADEVAGYSGHTVRLVGPLPPYSFC